MPATRDRIVPRMTEAIGVRPRQLDASAVGALAAHFGGEVLGPDDGGYDAGRRVWNARWDRHPALIVRPAGTADVVAAVRFAREQELPLAIRGGGHGAAGHGSIDDGLLIDLAHLNAVSIDGEAGLATVGGGALLSQLDQAAQALGLVCPVGVVGHTGVGGLTLGGGNGRLQRKLGMTIDNLRAVELVTADGRVVRASEEEAADLFWAIRGAGANFGVVTRFELALQPFDGRLTRGFAMFDGRDARAAWASFREFARSAADEWSLTLAVARALPEDQHPPAVAGRPVVFIGFNHCGDPAAAEAGSEQLFGGAATISRNMAGATYLDVQAMNDQAMGWGHRSHIRGALADDLADETLAGIVEAVADATAEASFGVQALGGAVGRIPPEATAYPGRSMAFGISADTMWEDPQEDATATAWVDGVMTIAERDAVPGRYVNEIGAAGSPELSRQIYAAAYDRLAAVKQAWDPENVFRMNHNVAPAGPRP